MKPTKLKTVRFAPGASQRGFTLIEVLAVMAILGLIAAIVIPNVTSFLTSGNLVGANQELLNVRTA